jgi:hypothetical protein
MNSTGLISKILAKIAEAQKPDRCTTDYLTNVLGYGSGSARPIIPLLKRLNFLQADGTPTQLYARFRNPSERGPAMLEALKNGIRSFTPATSMRTFSQRISCAIWSSRLPASSAITN